MPRKAFKSRIMSNKSRLTAAEKDFFEIIYDAFESNILCFRFGLFGEEPNSIDNLIRIFGVSREEINQSISKTFKTLKKTSLLQYLPKEVQDAAL